MLISVNCCTLQSHYKYIYIIIFELIFRDKSPALKAIAVNINIILNKFLYLIYYIIKAKFILTISYLSVI